jgi:hypothetical protein
MRTVLAALILTTALHAGKFYADDPVPAFPRPQNVDGVRPRKVNEYYDFFQNLFFRPGEQAPKSGTPTAARAVNTMGEVPDSEWYTNRHARRPMPVAELQRGPGNTAPPSMAKTWRVVSAKAEGITPGFTIVDETGRRYLIKFDPPSYPELASAADVISSKFLYALGYNVPENYIVRFPAEQLVLDEKSTFVDHYGKRRRMTHADLRAVMSKIEPREDGTIRALASRFVPGAPIGPFRYYGTRADDPNDTVPHEHRRDLRGLRVFAAWLGHDDSKSLNTLDTLVEENGVRFIKHYLIDFGSTLGSATYGPNSPRSGGDYLFAWGPAARQFYTFGLWVPKWAKASYPDIPAAGAFEYKLFAPDRWVPEYPNPAFSNMTREDAFWAARQVMAFSGDEIRAIVRTGEYSSRAAENWVAKCLIERRNKIGRAFFRQVLPLDGFVIGHGWLEFTDLEAKYFGSERSYRMQWYEFDNATGERRLIPGATGSEVPRSASPYLAVEISGGKDAVTVYVRHRREVVGREFAPAAAVLVSRR